MENNIYEIRPCPICGSTKDIEYGKEAGVRVGLCYIKCCNCGVVLEKYGKFYDVVERWNTRIENASSEINIKDIEDLEIIDFEMYGNVVRFYLGKNGEQWGDYWDDKTYEHNAGEVYDRFVKCRIDIYFILECDVYQPCSGEFNSHYSKEEMRERNVPCILIITNDVDNYDYYDTFSDWVKNENAIKIYFGDKITDVIERLEKAKCICKIKRCESYENNSQV